MSCQPNFEPGLQLECVREVISAIRNPVGDWKRTASAALWAAGCAIAMLPATDRPIFGSMDEAINLESLAEQVDYELPASGVMTSAISPQLIKLIIELILAWLKTKA